VAHWQGTLAVTAFSPDTSLTAAVRQSLHDLLDRMHRNRPRTASAPAPRGRRGRLLE
jgi:hypothetical protein